MDATASTAASAVEAKALLIPSPPSAAKIELTPAAVPPAATVAHVAAVAPVPVPTPVVVTAAVAGATQVASPPSSKKKKKARLAKSRQRAKSSVAPAVQKAVSRMKKAIDASSEKTNDVSVSISDDDESRASVTPTPSNIELTVGVYRAANNNLILYDIGGQHSFLAWTPRYDSPQSVTPIAAAEIMNAGMTEAQQNGVMDRESIERGLRSLPLISELETKFATRRRRIRCFLYSVLIAVLLAVILVVILIAAKQIRIAGF